ncbi:ATP-binding protein [Solihabitans fulvus]|uniref:ATP-binding protein n=1 Tax=Solihabitans fulvus TaxID=1892852 RepID=UPI001662194A|nr:sensor histidine kinase [Solihabitans fulvus]
MRRSTKLSTRILVSQLTILIITMVIGFVLYAQQTRATLDTQYEQRALAIAETVAALPQVRAAVAAGADPSGTVQALAEQIRHDVDAVRYVVVIDRDGIRLSHPTPAQIDKKIEEPVVALDGHTHVRTDPGSLGDSANGRAPVFGSDGRPIGEVSAGILEDRVVGQWWLELPPVALYTALALCFGAAVSLLLARRLKKTTFGLELHEIASLLQEREAMLHGVREGVVTFDQDGRVTLINDEARRLLGLPGSAIGQRLDALLPDGCLRDVLSGSVEGTDQIVLTDEHCLVVNRMAVNLRGQALGAVATLRDRTETEGLLRELTSTRGLTDALRAQQHEFANRLHTIAGLLELGRTDEALDYLTDTSGIAEGFAESVSDKIGDPMVAALVVAKASVAAERDVALLLTEDSFVDGLLAERHAVVTILGNLIDNAIDAAAGGPSPAHVTIRLRSEADQLFIRVSDTGPGIPVGADDSIFQSGFTTKPTRANLDRGLGLAIVRRLARRLDGQITVSEGPGPVFTVTLPDHASDRGSGGASDDAADHAADHAADASTGAELGASPGAASGANLGVTR